MIIDFHSHILPNMDDGAKNLDTSIKMLEKLKHDGVNIVIATPHFYRYNEEISSFLERRNNSFEKLSQAIKGKDYPKIILGAEVYLSKSFIYEDFDNLCIEDTEYLLLEMPWNDWNDDTMYILDNIISKSNVKIILAHIERYLKMVDKKYFNQVLKKDVLFQMNCDSFISMNIFNKKSLKNILDTQKVYAIGSDTHNMDTRPPNMQQCMNILNEKFDKSMFCKIMDKSSSILKKDY